MSDPSTPLSASSLLLPTFAQLLENWQLARQNRHNKLMERPVDSMEATVQLHAADLMVVFAIIDGMLRRLALAEQQQKKANPTPLDIATTVACEDTIIALGRLLGIRTDQKPLALLASQVRARVEHVMAQRERLARWVHLHPQDIQDPACHECCPGGEYVQAGFQCTQHLARQISLNLIVSEDSKK